MYGNGYECSGQNLSLEVANFGLGSVWSNITSIEERMNKIREIFDLKDGLYHFNISSIGYLAEALEINSLINMMKVGFIMKNTNE